MEDKESRNPKLRKVWDSVFVWSILFFSIGVMLLELQRQRSCHAFLCGTLQFHR